MQKVASTHQPHYLSWLGLVDKISKSDVHIILDDIQCNKRSFQHRTLYSTDSGAKYLSLSVNSKKESGGTLDIRDVKIADSKLLLKHFKTLEHRYSKAIGWNEIASDLESIYSKQYEYLIDLNLELLTLTLDTFNLKPKIVLSSDLPTTETKGALMYELTANVGCDVYLSGKGAYDYMQEVPFEKRLTDTQYQEFIHPEYNQSINSDFIAGCFALEMYIENPSLKNYFIENSTAEQPVRCG